MSLSITRYGVVGLIFRKGRVLVIRRGAMVEAPLKWCFPGGGIESGESQEEALVREFQEELGIAVTPIRRIWESVTPWRVHLDWWIVITDAEAFHPDRNEVDALDWMTIRELAEHPDLLSSNLEFLRGILSGEILL